MAGDHVVNTRGWSKEAKAAYALATELGWHPARAGARGNGVIMHSRFGDGRVNIPANLSGNGRAQANVLAEIRRHPADRVEVNISGHRPAEWIDESGEGVPSMHQLLHEHVEDMTENSMIFYNRSEDMVRGGMSYEQADHIQAEELRRVAGYGNESLALLQRAVADLRRTQLEEAHEEALLLHAALQEATTVQPTKPSDVGVIRARSATALMEFARTGESTDDAAKLLKVEPWLAKSRMTEGGGIVYPSRAVNERTWSNGTVDYVCSDGDFDADNPRSVASHFARAHQGRNASAAAMDRFLDPSVSWVPSERQAATIARLKNELDAARLALGPHTPHEALATWIVQHRIRDTSDERFGVPAVPLTAEQTLDRIRRLVDGGATRMLEQQNELLVEALAERTDKALSQEQVDAALAEAEQGFQQKLDAAMQRMEHEHQEEVQQLRSQNATLTGRWEALRELVTAEKADEIERSTS